MSKLEMNTVQWEEMESLVGKVFLAVDDSSGVKRVGGLYGRVCGVKPVTKGQWRRFKVKFFQTEEAAMEGSNGLVIKEEDMTIKQLKANTGFLAGLDVSEEESTAEEAEPTADRSKTPASRSRRALDDATAFGGAQQRLQQAAMAAGLDQEAIDQLAKVGVATVEAFESLKGVGEAEAQELAVEASLTLSMRMVLKAYMKPGKPAPSSPFLKGLSMEADAEEDEEDGAGGGGGDEDDTPLANVLLGALKGAVRHEAARDALACVCDALHGRLPQQYELKHAEGNLEVMLQHMKCTAAKLMPAGSKPLHVAMAVAAVAAAWKTAAGGKGGGGVFGGGGDDEVRAGVVGGKPDVAAAAALRGVTSDPQAMRELQRALSLGVNGDVKGSVAVMSALASNQDVAALGYLEEIKAPAGMPNTHAMQDLLHVLGRVQQLGVEWVAETLRGLLPVGCDALALAKHIATGQLDKIDFAAIFGPSSTGSLLGSLGGKGDTPRHLDATKDAMQVFVRGVYVLQVGYSAAHPFDTTVVSTLAQLATRVMKACGKGFAIGEACACTLDPLKREVTRQWKEVGRRAGMRPVMADVMVRLERELQEFDVSVARFAKPVEQGSPQEEVTRLRRQLGEKDREIASLKKQLSAAGGGGGDEASAARGEAFRKERAAWEAEPANAGKCIFMVRHGNCKMGKGCKHAATHPGHSQ